MANYSVSYLAPFAGGGHPLLPGRSQDVFFVDANHGSNDNNGKTLDRPLATITRAIALAEPTAAIFNRSTLIFAAPGEYRELVDVNKPDIAIIGSSGRYPGRTRIVGDGTTVQSTVRVLAPYLRGFTLANIFVETGYPGSTTVAAPAILLETSDDKGGDHAQLGANHQNYHFLLNNVQVESDGTTTAGLLLAGASMGKVINCTFAGCVRGVVFGPSLTNLNNSVSVRFIDCAFHDNTDADITTSIQTPPAIGTGQPISLDNIKFRGCEFDDVGGTPVTNYVDTAGGTHTNCVMYDCFFARDIADGTLMRTSAGWNVVGCWDPNGTVSFAGA